EKGMNITEAKDGDIAYDYIQDKSFDIILLDMMLPYKTGEELIKILRNNKSKDGNTYTPVIVISAKTELDTRLNAIQSGADDYITKPFDLNEVYVRIEALLRRSEGGEYVKKDDNEVLEALGVVFNVSDNEVTYEGKPIKLTAKEMKLLLLFMQNPKKTFTKANLYKSVWEDEYIYEDNTINVHMSNLRKKLAEATGKDVIETVWGIGYRLKEEE
ncbi:MAG: response regulator transcription factor, partial [Lachnospiraceae bacterium]|nr:response regulator transcription factor [Lachnospiraceae bacterium]